MTVDPERFLMMGIQAGKGGILAAGTGLVFYVGVGTLLVTTGRAPWSYPFLAISHDPVLNGLFSLIGLSAMMMSSALMFLAQISRAEMVDRMIVVLSGAFGVGFGGSLVRYTLPVVIEHVTRP